MAELPKFEDYLAPWEVGDDGKPVPEDDQAIDKGRLKKYLYGLLTDKSRLQTTVTEVTTERDTLKSKVDEIARKDESETERLKRELAEAQATANKSTEESAEMRALRLEVALEKGLTVVQARRLVGQTKEEMEADADALVESFGGSGKSGEDDSERLPSGRPQRRLVSAGGPGADDSEDIPLDKALDLIPRR